MIPQYPGDPNTVSVSDAALFVDVDTKNGATGLAGYFEVDQFEFSVGENIGNELVDPSFPIPRHQLNRIP
jgi:hypothetical protein